jgi:hypothetical protein
MRTMLLISVLATVMVRGEEPSGASMREKLRVKITESVPPPPAKQSAEKKEDEEAVAPVVVMKAMVISESKVVRDVAAAIAHEKQKKADEKFSPFDGGKIADIGPMQLGGWWSPEEGWTFLRVNKPPTRRQAEAAAATLKDLQEFADMAENRQPTVRPSTTKSPNTGWRRTTTDR